MSEARKDKIDVINNKIKEGTYMSKIPRIEQVIIKYENGDEEGFGFHYYIDDSYASRDKQRKLIFEKLNKYS